MKALAFILALLVSSPALAAEAIGYGGAKIQMIPIMAPYRTAAGVRYEVLVLRITFDVAPRDQPACWGVPIVHDRIIKYLHKAKLTSADFVGQRRDVLAEKLFDVAVRTIGKGYYTKLEIADPEKDDLNPTTSAQDKSQEEGRKAAKEKKAPAEGQGAAPGGIHLTLTNNCK